MSGTALSHLLVRDYLRELDAALAGLPARQAGELREQITTHLDEVLPPGASDDQVSAELRRLGSPGDLAAEAGAGLAAGAAGSGSASGGRLRPWLAQLSWRARVLATVAVLAVAAAIWYVTAAQTAASLAIGPSSGWWYPVDATHQTSITADNVSQDTVPIRVGQRQGLFFYVNNPSSWTQTVTGFGPDYDGSPAGSVAQLGVSTRGTEGGAAALPDAQHYRLPVVIPPHQSRIIRLLWTSEGCMEAGDSEGIDYVSLTVRVGAWRRTEILPLDGEWGLSGHGHVACS